MIKHIVMWRFKDQAAGASKSDNLAKAKEMLNALNGQIAEIGRLETGINENSSDAAWDLALCSEFGDEAALEVYQKHPAHLEVVAFVKEVVAHRALVDYTA